MTFGCRNKICFSAVLLALLLIPTLVAANGKELNYFDDGNEPPTNPFVADSPWPQSQRNSYCQASSPYAGPTQSDQLEVDYLLSAPVSVTVAYSSPDANGDRALWQNNVLFTGTVDTRNQELKDIDKEISLPTADAFAGAYTLVDKDDVFYAGREATLRSFQYKVAGDPFSGMAKLAEYPLPESALGGDGDALRGVGMLYDGHLTFSTSKGVVGVIRRDFTGIQVLKLEGEEISNLMSVDETGGIYVVTSKKMHRIQWDGTSLSIKWSADYEIGPENPAGGRLGTGSGSTPTLMGTGNQDKFVVITDGRELMHLVLFWRDEIPAGWEPIAPGKDIRIAAEVPITFGDPNASKSVSEQSVLVRGYGAVVVNNDYGVSFPSWVPSVVNQLFVSFTNWPCFAPYGVEKFEWNPTTRTLESVWANADISCPNGIPTMSAATNLMYCVGQRESVWNIEAMDWDTGESVFFKELGGNGDRLRGRSPQYNSAYAATTIGLNGEILSGALTGIFRARIKA